MNLINNLTFKVLFVLFWTTFSVFCISKPVAAYDKNILIAPTRVILDGKTRSTVVKLININNKSASFRVDLGSTHMDEYGQITHVESPSQEEMFAQKMIRFSPRRVTIGPKGWQIVRIMVRKPKDLPAGEYRTQLKVTPILQQETKEEIQETKGVGVKINFIFATSIPIIVRHGEGGVNIIPRAPKLITKDQKYFLETPLERTGLFSSYFNFHAFFIPSGKTERILIGSRKGSAIYAQNKNRIILVPVKNKDILTKGQIEIKITDREKADEPILAVERFEYSQ